ncbi:MAG: hypothetical protein JKX72_05575 [Robiginitomaculum sp.]|nr:hypothetical protein [Robiginitomaculum sp.]
MYKFIKFITICASAILSSFNISFAQEPERLTPIIDKVAHVYGVEKLNNARTVRVEEDIRINYADHAFSPAFNQFTHGRRSFVFDLKNKKGSGEYYTNFSGNHNHAREFKHEDEFIMIEYGNSTYIPRPNGSYYAFFGAAIRGSDTLLANALIENRARAKDKGQKFWQGEPHNIISIDFPSSPPLDLYINKNTGYISKMARTVGEGDDSIIVSYTFNDHTKKKGVVFAQESTVFIGADLLQYSFNRKVVLNAKADRNDFKLDAGIVKEPARMDTSEMTADRISARSHHVGQDGRYTTFIDMGDYIVGLGAYAGLADKFAAYKAETKSTKPLTYLLVTDHHEGESMGAVDAVKLGATLIATPGSKPTLERLLAEFDAPSKIEYVDDVFQVGDIQFINLSTGHAENVLVAYSAADKLLFQTEHYVNPYASEVFYTKNSAVTLYNALKRKGLDIDTFIDAESRRPETWANFEMAIKAHKPKYCPPKRQICKGF